MMKILNTNILTKIFRYRKNMSYIKKIKFINLKYTLIIIYIFVILFQIYIYLNLDSIELYIFSLVLILEIFNFTIYFILKAILNKYKKEINNMVEINLKECNENLEFIKLKYKNEKNKITKMCIFNGKDILEINLNDKKNMIIGKENNNTKVDIDLTYHEYSLLISKIHALLNKIDDIWYIEDLCSKNGTYIERNLSKRKLEHNEKIEIQKNDFVYLSMIKILFV